MAYFLEALVFRAGDIAPPDLPASVVRIVSLTPQLSLLPLTDEVIIAAKAVAGVPSRDAQDRVPLPPLLVAWARHTSRDRAVAYLAAEFFGGVGKQFSIVWSGGEIVLGPQRAPDAINQALRLLGVKVIEDRDEFDSVGLGRHRHTDQWV